MFEQCRYSLNCNQAQQKFYVTMQEPKGDGKPLSEKQAARLINVSETVFNYYARAGRGPEAVFVGPDGRRYYESATVEAWCIPPRKNAKQKQAGEKP